MKSYEQTLRESVHRAGSNLCLGIDPTLDRFGGEMAEASSRIQGFYVPLLERLSAAGSLPAAVKLNLGCFEQFGAAGAEALLGCLASAHGLGLPAILDAKRGDIGASAQAYATALYNTGDPAAVTVSPYMGSDSLAPFTGRAGKGTYILCRTSNPGANDLQELLVDGRPLYERVAELIATAWHAPGVGAVVGATAPRQLGRIAEIFLIYERPVPLLIPGVGAQGGSAEEVAKTLRSVGYPGGLVLVNVSRAIADAPQPIDFVQRLRDQLKALHP